MMLTLYMLVGISALALWFFYCRSRRFRPGGTPPEEESALLEGRWPLRGQKPVFTAASADSVNVMVNREWFRRMLAMGMGMIALTLVIFLSVPRLGRSAWRGISAAPRETVGFDDSVTLGEMGQILEDRREVMQVKLNDWKTGAIYPKMPEIYLRGAALTRYEDNAWSPEPRRRGRIGLLSTSLPPQRQLDSTPVVETIVIEPMLEHDELFAVWPVVPVEANEDLLYDRERQRLIRPDNLRRSRFEYRVGTFALKEGRQPPLLPNQAQGVDPSLVEMPDLPRLRAMADAWVGESGLDPQDHLAVAKMLESRFLDPTRFQYSLEGQPRSLDMDNVEDFLVSHPKGHCEYFASALALMLRSQGIPSRLVIGYRCDEYNDLGDYYRVRQLHAHSWVEAYLAPECLPPEVFDGERPLRWRAGGWLRLEPTPGADAADPSRRASLLDRIEAGFHWLQSFWSDYVVEMDRGRQRKAIYEPAVKALKTVARDAVDPEWWRTLPERIRRALVFSAWFSEGGWQRWLMLAAAVALAVPAGLFVGRRLARLIRWFWRRWADRGRAKDRRRRSRVAFYRRLEAVLGRHGLVRSAGQTPQEFALAAGARLAQRAGRPDLATLPPQVVDAFYQVRFGGLALQTAEAEAVESALVALEGVPPRRAGLASR
jgi:hypothetical protein